MSCNLMATTYVHRSALNYLIKNTRWVKDSLAPLPGITTHFLNTHACWAIVPPTGSRLSFGNSQAEYVNTYHLTDVISPRQEENPCVIFLPVGEDK